MIPWLNRKPHEVTQTYEQLRMLSPQDQVLALIEALTGERHFCIPNVFWNVHPHPYQPFREFHAYVCYSRFNHAPGSHSDAPTAQEYADYWASLSIELRANKQHPEVLKPHHIYGQIFEYELLGLDKSASLALLDQRILERAILSLVHEVPWRYEPRTENLGPRFGG